MPKPEGKRDFSSSFRHEKQMLISFFYLTVSGNNWEKKNATALQLLTFFLWYTIGMVL